MIGSRVNRSMMHLQPSDFMNKYIGRYRSFINDTSLYSLKVLVLILLVFIVGSLVSFLNRQRYLEIYRAKISLTNITKDSGYSYYAVIGRTDLSSEYQVSKGELFEDGVLLNGIKNADLDYIRQVGAGSQLFWRDKIYFATSDNQDPRINGKKYEISYPVIVRFFIAFPLYLLTLLLFVHLTVLLAIKPPAIVELTKLFTDYLLPNKEIVSRLVGTVLVLLVILAALLYLNQHNILVFQTRVSPITNIKPESGFSFYSDVRALDIKWDRQTPSLVEVLENGQPLFGSSNPEHSQIKMCGRGAFVYGDGYIFFSSSDNTSPLSNNRHYEISYPQSFDSLIAWFVYAITLIMLLVYWLLKLYLDGTRSLVKLISVVDKYQLTLSVIVVISTYFIPRLPWFLDYQVPLLAYDSASYFVPIKAYLSGTTPLFDVRTIGYPAFILLTSTFSKSLTSVVVAQCLITLLSSLILLTAINRTFPAFTLLSGLGIASYVAQPMVATNDFMLLTESLYGSVIILIIAMLFITLKKRNGIVSSLLLSIFIALAVLIRPSAIFLISLYLFVLVFMLINKHSYKRLLSLVLPMPLIFLAYLSYNNYTLGKYSFSFLGNATLFAVTSYMWEPDPKFPPEINENLISRFKAEIPANDREIIDNSWDFNAFYRAVVPLIDKAFYATDAAYVKATLLDYSKNNKAMDPKADNLMGKIAIHAIKSHPGIYTKFFLMNFTAYFDDRTSWQIKFYRDMSWMLQNMYIDGLVNNDSIKSAVRVYRPVKHRNNIDISDMHKDVVVKPTHLVVLNELFTTMLADIYDNNIWTYLYFAVFVLSIGLVISGKVSDPDMFILFAVSSIMFLSGVMYAAVTTITDRYPSPTRFIEVLSVLYFAHLISNKKQFKTYVKKRINALS